MLLTYRRLSLSAALLLAACPSDNNMTTAGPDTTTGDDSTSGSPTTLPTTSATEPTTSGSTSTEGSSGTESGSSTGAPPVECSTILDKNSCALSNECKWSSVVSYTHGTQGCQGSIQDFCIPKDVDAQITSYWKDNDGDIQVLQFSYDPTDLGPEWQPCGCDGPLACLCTSATLDCPERLGDFCGAITGQNGCNNAATGGKLVCSWFSTSAEGPKDTMCDDDPQLKVCLPATNTGANTCDPITLPYMECMAYTTPIFWRDNDGIIEVTTSCGPEPVGWTKCVDDDPTQPEECKCRCL